MYEIDDRSIKKIKDKLLFSLTNLGHPHITVTDGNYENRGELYLKHRYDGVDLRVDYARLTIERLYRIWSRPVHLQTVLGDSLSLFTYDGSSHKERTITEKNAA
jgi:stage V sporulation protein R